MKTLADLKRRCNGGAVLTMTEHSAYPHGSLIGQPRKIQAVQGNGIALEAETSENGSWHYWQPAKHYTITPAGFRAQLDPNDSGAYMSYTIEATA